MLGKQSKSHAKGCCFQKLQPGMRGKIWTQMDSIRCLLLVKLRCLSYHCVEQEGRRNYEYTGLCCFLLHAWNTLELQSWNRTFPLHPQEIPIPSVCVGERGSMVIFGNCILLPASISNKNQCKNGHHLTSDQFWLHMAVQTFRGPEQECMK